MSLEKRMKARRQRDEELEQSLDVRKNDPTVDLYGGIRYSRKDVEDLEEDRVPWLRAKRRAS